MRLLVKAIQCEVCGYSSNQAPIASCAAASITGCNRGRHAWCKPTDEEDDCYTQFICNECKDELDLALLADIKKMVVGENGMGRADSHFAPDAAAEVKQAQGERKVARPGSNLPEAGSRGPKPAVRAESTAAHAEENASAAGAKRSSKLLPPSGRPTAKARVEGPGPATARPDLLSSTMAGLQKERQRHKASREMQASPPAHAESESRSEQRLKQRALRSHQRVSPSVLWEQQQTAIAASLKEKVLWQGSLTALFGDGKALSTNVLGYGVAGNVHAMDAVMRLPKDKLQGSFVSAKEALEMTTVEAADNAALIFKGTSDEDFAAFAELINKHLFPEKQLIQVLLGEDKPIWMALVPGPDNVCLGVFVRFAEKWVHSDKRPDRGLLRTEGLIRRQKLTWPDQAKSTIRASACERGPGPQYTPNHIYRPQDSAPEPEEASKVRPKVPEPGPLSDMSVAIVGFIRDHEAIRDLRRKLREAGAQTFTNNAPWPGCVNVMVFPEQMIEKDLGLENSAPKELQPIKDFLLAKGTRLFIKIDYPSLCTQMRRRLTPAEESLYKIRELWPEGIQVTADAQTLHAAAVAPCNGSSHSQLEQIFEELQAGAAAANNSTCVWMLSVAEEDLKSLEESSSPAFPLCTRHMQSKRCGKLEGVLGSSDVLQNALRLAHFFRFYCRHAILLIRPEDQELWEAAELRKTIHCASIEHAADFLQSLRL